MTADIITMRMHRGALPPTVRNAPGCAPAPDFRYCREAPRGAPDGAPEWRVVVRTYGTPAERDEVVTVRASTEDEAVARALGRVRREQNVEGRRYLPALEAVHVAPCSVS